MKPNIQIWDIARVIPYDTNVKEHGDQQVTKIANSIKEFGWTQPIVVDKKGVIIAGHGRRMAAIKLGFKQVPVWVRDDLTDAQVRALRLADNRVAISNIDADLLAKELADLEFDMSGFYDPKELDFVTADLGELNHDAFVRDLDAEIHAQASETTASITASADKPVKVEKALGFKTIKGSDERAVAIFMANLETESGKTGADAFMEFVNTMNKSLVTQ